MKILILGAGAIGGYFGARLMNAGADITFLVRPARRDLLAQQGLRIASPHGDFHVTPTCVVRDELRPQQAYDLIVLAPKAYDLDHALDDVAPAVGPDTALLPLLNGLTHLATLDARFGRHRVLGGIAHLAGELTADGVVHQYTPMHRLIVGGRDAATQAIARRFIDASGHATFDRVLAEDIEAALWEKWTFLATLAGMTTLLRASVGEILAQPHGEALIRSLYGECLAVAAAAGKPVTAEGQARAAAMLFDRNSALSASMRRDLEAGLRTEHEHVLGELLRLAETHDLKAPLLSTALTQMALRAAARGETA